MKNIYNAPNKEAAAMKLDNFWEKMGWETSLCYLILETKLG